jgi:hypothetical protein
MNERFHAKGRMLPEGLAYLNSWLEKDGNRCFQLMETNDLYSASEDSGWRRKLLTSRLPAVALDVQLKSSQ